MVSLKHDTKERFDSLKPEDDTQDEFVRKLLNAYEQNGKGIDPEVWADHVAESIAQDVSTKVELGAYRAVEDYFESHDV